MFVYYAEIKQNAKYQNHSYIFSDRLIYYLCVFLLNSLLVPAQADLLALAKYLTPADYDKEIFKKF
ncbi:hypothetical protein BpHYR1_001097 [Brachionus plicatilis]|uniref:Uncharacterized protein n=1 Tax=Brachionus plicatilis TaxID=10195 RepID=A0A3M7SXG9_BRAPC|nr:hypothetical protein BpHYR1_001097 [Brachionus plicatilis]